MNKLAKNGHKPRFSKATVNKLISKRGEVVYVLIPFKVKEGYKAAGVGYVISESGYRAFATEIYEKDGKTYTNAYYVDTDGNVVVLSGDQNYWGCVSLCLAQFCADSPTYCEICGGFCYICIAAPEPLACGMFGMYRALAVLFTQLSLINHFLTESVCKKIDTLKVHKVSMVEYERMAVYPWHLAIAILFSYITLAFGLGLKSVMEVYNEYVAFAAFLILLLGFTLPFWMNALFRKIAVDDKGITFKRGLNFKIPVLYEFDRFYAYDDLEWAKERWIFVDIKGKLAFANPRWVIVPDSQGFIEAVKKHDPELIKG